MPDTEQFLALAEIAGVFVGFGALIAIRSASAGDLFEVTSISQVVEYGIMVVVLALAPVVIGPLGISGHALWWACSVAFLALFWLGDLLLRRMTPERRAAIRYLEQAPARMRRLVYGVSLAFVLPMTLVLVVVLLGVRPDIDAALYFAALALLLVVDAGQLLWTVVGIGFPRPAPGAGDAPAVPG